MADFTKIESVIGCNVYQYIYQKNKNNLDFSTAIIEIACENENVELLAEILNLDMDLNISNNHIRKIANCVLCRTVSHVGRLIYTIKRNKLDLEYLINLIIDNYLIYKANTLDIQDLFNLEFSNYKLKEVVTHMILENDNFALRSLVKNPHFSIDDLPNMIINRLPRILIEIIRF